MGLLDPPSVPSRFNRSGVASALPAASAGLAGVTWRYTDVGSAIYSGRVDQCDGTQWVTIVPASGTYAPIAVGRPQVVNPSALVPLAAKLADANNRVVNIGCLGDSLTVGKYANGSTAESNATNQRSWREHGWVANLASMFHNSGRYGGNAGEGVVKLYSIGTGGTPEDDRITQSTAISGTAPGITQHGNVIPASQSVTFADTNHHTDIDIVYYTPNPTTGYADATYTVDGGTPVALPLGTANTFTKVTISGLSDAPHTVVVTAGAGGTFYLSHFIARRSATNGVIVHRMGRGGATTVHLTGSGLVSSTRTNLFKAQFDQQSLDALVLMVGFNDWNTSIDPATFATNLGFVLSYLTIPVLLVPDPRATEIGSVKPNTQAAMYAAMKALAVPGSNVAFADPAGELIGTFEAGNAVGAYADTIHLVQTYHALHAKGVFEVLTRIPTASAVAA